MDTSSTDLKAIMRRDERRRGMLGDPDLTGDTLLLALALDEVIAIRLEQGKQRIGQKWVREVTVLAHGPDSLGLRQNWVKNTIADDVPRYEPEGGRGRATCAEPMIRREGPCGHSATVYFLDSDPETGASRWVGLCRRHRDQQRFYDERRAAWLANGKPTPPANIGGVLRRHFRLDWDSIYRWASPDRPPMDGGRAPTPRRPILRLVGEEPATPTDESRHPMQTASAPLSEGRIGSAENHQQALAPLPRRYRNRRKCLCGCGGKASHSGHANGIAVVWGCEMSMRRWVRSRKAGPEEELELSGDAAVQPRHDADALRGEA